MSKCTAAQAIAAAEYWLGYCEKASSSYSTSRDKTVFTANSGAGNYTYAGWLCDCNGQSWCAAQVTTAITEACGESKSSHTNAKAILHGVWPYINVVQVYDAAPAAYKGKAASWGGSWKPAAGDIVIFDWEHDGSRDHTGLVYKVDSTTLYCIEGNSQNMVRKTSYPLSSKYLWGYVRPLYADAVSGGTVAGKTAKASVTLPYIGSGYTADASYIKTAQILLNGKGAKLDVDGECGDLTIAAIKKYAASDGILGPSGWAKLLA